MKIKSVVLSFLASMVLMMLFPVNVNAYETTNCQGFHYGMFDFGPDGFAVLKNKPATLLVMPEIGLTSDYHTYVNYNNAWIDTGISNVSELGGVSFPDAVDYRIAAFFKSSTGGVDYYCSNVVAQVFETEVVSTGNWVDFVHTAYSPTSYISPDIVSGSGKPIAGLQYELTDWSCDGGYCFHHVSAPTASVKAAGNGTWVMGYVYSSGMKDSVNFVLEPGTGMVQGRINNLSVYTRNYDGLLSEAPAPPVFLRVDSLSVDSDTFAIGDSLQFSFNVNALGQNISNVYLKLGSLETGKHLVANILDEASSKVECSGSSCSVRSGWRVPDNGVIREYLNKPLAVWVVVKTDKMACTDKPGTSALTCGAGVKNITILSPEKLVVDVTPGPIAGPPVAMAAEEVSASPTPTIVERIVVAVEEVVVKPIRKTAAQIVGEYFESQQHQQAVSVSELEVDENSVISIPEPNWNIFGW